MTRRSDSADAALVALLGETRQPVKRLSGFEKHHFVPPRADGYHNAWIGKIAEAELAAELDELCARARERFGWKRRDLRAAIDAGEATLAAPDWQYRVTVRLDPERKGQILWERRLEPAPARPTHPEHLDALFEPAYAALEILPPSAADVPALIDRFEERGWPVDYPHDAAYAAFDLPGGGTLRVETRRIRFEFGAPSYPGELLRAAQRLLAPAGDEPAGPTLLLLA